MNSRFNFTRFQMIRAYGKKMGNSPLCSLVSLRLPRLSTFVFICTLINQPPNKAVCLGAWRKLNLKVNPYYTSKYQWGLNGWADCLKYARADEAQSFDELSAL